MNPKRAAEVLSVDLETATVEDVRSATADAIRAAHPDNGGDPALASIQLKRAKTARDVLLRHLASGLPSGKKECPLCDGSGQLKVRGAFKAQDCPRCKGEGVVNL